MASICFIVAKLGDCGTVLLALTFNQRSGFFGNIVLYCNEGFGKGTKN